MAFDPKKWLIDEFGFSEAEAAELAPKFEGERVKKLEGGFLRQADYSRKMNEVQKLEAGLKEANERLNNEVAEWATAQAQGKEQTVKQRADLDKAQADVLRLTQVVNRVANEAGLDPAKVLEGAAVTVPAKTEETPAVDLSGYVKADQFGQVVNSMVDFPAELQAIAEEHRELYGARLDTREIVKELKTRAATRGNQKSLDPRVIWEETHGVPQKREEVSAAKRQADLDEAEKRGYERARTEEALPGQPPPHRIGNPSPVMGQRTSVMQRAQPGSVVQKAVSALRSGKYRTQDTKPA